MSATTLVQGILKAPAMSLILMSSAVLLTGCGGGSADTTRAQTESTSTANTDNTSDSGSSSAAHSLSLSAQPASATIYEGQSKTFSLSVNHNYPVTISWYKNGSKINGATGTSYTVSSATLASAGSFTCSVTDGELTVNCSSFALTVNQKVAITSQPANQMVNEGLDVSLAVTASGTGPLSYQWYFNGQKLNGKTSANLDLNSVTLAADGNYYCIVSNAGTSATSNTVAVDVISSAATGSAKITWEKPTKRADGSNLDAADIANYELFYSTSASGSMQPLATLNANEYSIIVDDLSVGTHYFAMRTVDTDGSESGLSEKFSVQIN